MAPANTGELALREAAWKANNELVDSLLQRYRADPNFGSNTGVSPLIEECQNPLACGEVVRLLLEAGADPTVAAEDGDIPLHKVVSNNRMDLIDMLYSRAPTTLNRCTENDETSLYLACYQGHDRVVSKLLSLGAMQPMPLYASRQQACPLRVAVAKGLVGVVRVLIREGGIRAVGGEAALPLALTCAIQFRQAIILRLLLAVGGKEKMAGRANTCVKTRSLLHYAAAYTYPAAVSVLLKAGADVAWGDGLGRTARDNIGACLDRVDAHQKNAGDGVAVRRMLNHGPAYRARSWAWTRDEQEDTGGSGDRDHGATTGSFFSFLLALIPPRNISLRICWPKEEKPYINQFMTRIDR